MAAGLNVHVYYLITWSPLVGLQRPGVCTTHAFMFMCWCDIVALLYYQYIQELITIGQW